MANAAPKIVARNFHEAHTFAREVLKLSQGTYRVVANPAALFGYGEVHLVPGWDKRPDRFAVRNKLRYTRLTVIDHSEDPAEAQDESSNGDNMVSEGGPVFTIFSDPEAWLKATADTVTKNVDALDRALGGPGLAEDEIHDVDTRHTPEEWAEKLAEQEEWQARGPRADGTFESDDKPAEEQEVIEDVEEEPAPADTDEGVKEAGPEDDDERPLNGRRRRRCKDCGDLIHPDDVEEHAAEEASKKAALEKKAQERLK